MQIPPPNRTSTTVNASASHQPEIYSEIDRWAGGGDVDRKEIAAMIKSAVDGGISRDVWKMTVDLTGKDERHMPPPDLITRIKNWALENRGINLIIKTPLDDGTNISLLNRAAAVGVKRTREEFEEKKKSQSERHEPDTAINRRARNVANADPTLASIRAVSSQPVNEWIPTAIQGDLATIRTSENAANTSDILKSLKNAVNDWAASQSKTEDRARVGKAGVKILEVATLVASTGRTNGIIDLNLSEFLGAPLEISNDILKLLCKLTAATNNSEIRIETTQSLVAELLINHGKSAVPADITKIAISMANSISDWIDRSGAEDIERITAAGKKILNLMEDKNPTRYGNRLITLDLSDLLNSANEIPPAVGRSIVEFNAANKIICTYITTRESFLAANANVLPIANTSTSGGVASLTQGNRSSHPEPATVKRKRDDSISSTTANSGQQPAILKALEAAVGRWINMPVIERSHEQAALRILHAARGWAANPPSEHEVKVDLAGLITNEDQIPDDVKESLNNLVGAMQKNIHLKIG